MNKMFMTLGISGLFALTGCGANQMADRDIYEESGHTVNVNNQRAEIYNKNMSNKSEDFGYVRHQKNPVNGRTNSHKFSALDREKLADSISKLSSDLPNVHDVATLVTDEEVLIAYQTDAKDRNLTADQVKKTAISVVPRFYHVYVTDNKNLIKNVENFATLDSDSRNVDSMVDRLIVQMLKSPQGAPLTKMENENDVINNDMSENRQRNFTPTQMQNNR
ncbi:YhcN/YlaJ family sporulation lipoprotein [Bacillus sp. CGMCC 1.16607]|uniref:YhcN/YlaJ family sporulation lipoprotein n=1 Tax=Bacillus sp. CGMCC 1.16607 TaxID=3351842 RepID=UPI0036362057